MTSLPQGISREAQEAIKWLAAEFNFANEMIEDENKVQSDVSSGRIPAALKDLREVLRDFKLVARAERREHREEERILRDLQKLENEVDGMSHETIAGFLKELSVASGHLKEFASFYRGSLRDEIGELEGELEAERKYEGLVKRLPDDEGLQKKLNAEKAQVEAELKGLKAKTVELRKWIVANQQVVRTIRDWAAQLE